ncbi:MAG: DPP IV N-terminal domain-containing protein [Gemmatimonadota bacterium]
MMMQLIGSILVASSALRPGDAVAQTLESVQSTGSAEARYQQAERYLGWNAGPLVVGSASSPNWMEGGNRFWVRVSGEEGHDFLRVDPDRGQVAPLFDNARMAAAMSMAADTAFDPVKLPFTTFDLVNAEAAIAFQVGERRFTCGLADYACVVGDTVPDRTAFVRSPDGEWEAFIHEHDLWVRPWVDNSVLSEALTDSTVSPLAGDSVRLTTDGEELWAYGYTAPRPGQLVRPRPQRPVLQWSPDSRRIAVQRMDERGVEMLPLYSSTSTRPKGYEYPYPLPGDSIIGSFDVHVVDVAARTNVKVDYEPQPYLVYGTTGMMDSTWINVKWKNGGDRLYYTHGTRGGKRIQLMEVDPANGDARLLVRDTMYSYVELNLDIRDKPNWDVVNGGDDIIWFSERDGWGHLYRFDRNGNLKNQITRGPWTVGTIQHIDEAQERIRFTARGTREGVNPALQAFYSVRFDGTGLERLAGGIAEAGADHAISPAPSGSFFVDAMSRPDLPSRVVVRDRAGAEVAQVARASVERLEEMGWSLPIPFTTKARDGISDIHGLMYLPSDFDPEKRYPVIEHIYPGPFIGSVGFWTFSAEGRGDQRALAELGFVVVQIDHMGSPFRSKRFQDNYFGNMGDHGLPDHMAALKELAARNPWMDLDRVGIYGHSGGGFASTAAILQYPDFYKVAVSTAGNHDNRTYHAAYGEKYQGIMVRDTIQGTDNYANQVNFEMAEKLEGKLFLMTGDMDDNVHPAMTYRMADALIRANKSFDFLILPDRAHGLNEPYVVRRRWDYFLEYLLGVTPPRDYLIRRVESSGG